MLLNLEKAKKLETISENFMKKVEKAYQDLVPEKRLVDNKLEGSMGQQSIDKYLSQFVWNEGKFPRSASLFDQINQMDAELQEMDKRFKILQQNFYDSKSAFTNNFDKKSSLASMMNNDLNEVIFDLVEKKEITMKLDFFIQNSSYLQSYIVFIPENDFDNF